MGTQARDARRVVPDSLDVSSALQLVSSQSLLASSSAVCIFNVIIQRHAVILTSVPHKHTVSRH